MFAKRKIQRSRVVKFWIKRVLPKTAFVPYNTIENIIAGTNHKTKQHISKIFTSNQEKSKLNT